MRFRFLGLQRIAFKTFTHGTGSFRFTFEFQKKQSTRHVSIGYFMYRIKKQCQSLDRILIEGRLGMKPCMKDR